MRAVELPLPAAKRAVVSRLARGLARVPGVVAVALGGSYARGTQRPDSDVDLGVYYDAAAPFRVGAIRRLAARVANAPPVVTEFYEWGRWVNGGAWIPTSAGKVDLLYRNLRQVRSPPSPGARKHCRHGSPRSSATCTATPQRSARR